MRVLLYLSASLLTATLCLSGCNPASTNETSQAEREINESEALNRWFQDRFDDELARSPMTQTYLGQKQMQNMLDDSSKLALDEGATLTENWLKELRAQYDIDRLDDQSKLSYRLFEYAGEDKLRTHSYADHDYVFQHMSGSHSDLPSFMINFHAVSNSDDAKAYIARLSGFKTFLGEYAKQAQAQFDNGVSLPKFVYPKIIDASKNVISGAPFNGPDDSPLFADIKKKVGALAIEQSEKDSLLAQAEAALRDSVEPAYNDLIAMFEIHGAQASEDDGAWKLPKGAEYYQARLNHYTTTNMTADEIHEIGLKDVARVQDEMRVIMRRVGFDGTLREFFTHLRTDPKFTLSNDDTGRASYIAQATEMIDTMKRELDGLFITKPKADMIVKRVEPFREDTAFGAFYDQPALDGSRPGTYYINLKDMNELPIYQMQALAYHEGIPGHHMQIAIGMELEGLPKFRTLGGHTSYIEGWALYSEGLPKELGLFTDPYQEFGQLSMEIFRSARLVLDTGIHAKKWTREQAVQYMLDNTANSEGDVRAEIDRYIVWPGQATAYKIGMIKIQSLRKKAETALGDTFDIREFHDVILANGSVPLTILEELVDSWIAQKQS